MCPWTFFFSFFYMLKSIIPVQSLWKLFGSMYKAKYIHVLGPTLSIVRYRLRIAHKCSAKEIRNDVYSYTVGIIQKTGNKLNVSLQ